MHKRYWLASLSILFAALTATGGIRSFALYVNGAGSVGLNIVEGSGSSSSEPEPTINYYLIGSFNSWTEKDNSYILTDVTSEMSEETNKVAEYKIENIPLDKGDKLKVVSDEASNNWYGASDKYEHHWSNAIDSDSDGNYVVPMTSNSYTIYFKLFSDNSYKFYITAEKDVLFFRPNTSVNSSSDYWCSGSALLMAHFYGDSGSTYVSLEESSTSGYYKTSIPDGYTGLIILRLDPNTSSNAGNFNWNYDGHTVWNRSGDFSVPFSNTDTNNCITNNEWDWWNNGWENSCSWSAM